MQTDREKEIQRDRQREIETETHRKIETAMCPCHGGLYQYWWHRHVQIYMCDIAMTTGPKPEPETG